MKETRLTGLFDLRKICRVPSSYKNCLSLSDEKWSEWVEVWTQVDAKASPQMALDLHQHNQRCFTPQVSSFIWSRHKNDLSATKMSCHLNLQVVPKHCSAVMTCTLNEVQPALITVKPFTSSGGLEISLGGQVVLVHFGLLSTREGGRLAV